MSWQAADVKQRVEANKVIIFAKGTKEAPMCGFSARAIQIVGSYNKPFEVVNIFEHPSVRPALVEYSKWPTTPQVFVNGELIGGSDITMELHESGELGKKMEAAFA